MLTGRMTKRRSNAKNAYDLMSDIKEYILEEPKRVYMGDWLIRGRRVIKDFFETEGPACGTVGCIAGNAVMLAGNPEGRNVVSQSLEILGGDNFTLRRKLEHDLFLDCAVDAKYGTKKYARIVAGRITKFQKYYKEALREVKIGV